MPRDAACAASLPGGGAACWDAASRRFPLLCPWLPHGEGRDGGRQRSRSPGEHLTRDSSLTDSALHASAGTTQRAARGASDTHAPPCNLLSSSCSQPSHQSRRVLLGQRERALLTRAWGKHGLIPPPPVPSLCLPLPLHCSLPGLKPWWGWRWLSPYYIHWTGITGGRWPCQP